MLFNIFKYLKSCWADRCQGDKKQLESIILSLKIWPIAVGNVPHMLCVMVISAKQELLQILVEVTIDYYSKSCYLTSLHLGNVLPSCGEWIKCHCQVKYFFLKWIVFSGWKTDWVDEMLSCIWAAILEPEDCCWLYLVMQDFQTMKRRKSKEVPNRAWFSVCVTIIW